MQKLKLSRNFLSQSVDHSIANQIDLFGDNNEAENDIIENTKKWK